MIRSLLVIITIASLLVEGWKIDSSCTRAGIADKVQDALFSAFDMAERGREALKSGHDAIRGDTVLRGPEVQRLVEHLFYKGSRSGQDRQKLYLQKVYFSYTNILRYIRDPGKVDNPDDTDAVIYCDDKRWKRSPNLKWVEDKDSGAKAKYFDRPCKGNPITEPSDRVALAVTFGKVQDKDGNKLTTQIQLCSWYVELIKDKPWWTWKGIGAKTKIGKTFIDKAKSNKWGFAQIDVYNLLDKVLLHELTHVPNGLYMDDVKVGTFWSNPLLPGKPAYGWNRCGELARNGDVVDRPAKDPPTAPDLNADTVALFANVCQLMSTGPKGQGVDSMGRVYELEEPVDLSQK